MSINPEAFQESITKELEVVKDRVRNLIGDANWAEEGRYKEAILMNVIRRFLPSNLSVGTGFIAKSNRNQITVSKQIDIIVYDNTIPVLFSEGSFIITTNRNVKAIVEVKTHVSNNQLVGAMQFSIDNGKLIETPIFNGVFAFDYATTEVSLGNLERALQRQGENARYVNHLCLGPHVFVKYWPRTTASARESYGIYDFRSARAGSSDPKKLSFSYFISNLLYSISGKKLSDRLWVLFPVEEGKEAYRIRTAYLETAPTNQSA